MSEFIISNCIFFIDDHSRVILTMQHEGESDYINANYIDVRFKERRAFCGLLLRFNYLTRTNISNSGIQLS